MELLWRYRNATLYTPGFSSPIHVHVYVYIYIYIRGWTHGARTIMRTGCYKYSIRCSNLLVDEVIIPGLTGSTGAWYSSNGNKTRVEQRWATWTDGQPCEYAGFEYAPVRMHTRVAYVYS